VPSQVAHELGGNVFRLGQYGRKMVREMSDVTGKYDAALGGLVRPQRVDAFASVEQPCSGRVQCDARCQ
jgi:hypothetical protein